MGCIEPDIAFFRYEPEGRYSHLTGWYWLDKTRGTWEGPFKTKEEAEADRDNPPWDRL